MRRQWRRAGNAYVMQRLGRLKCPYIFRLQMLECPNQNTSSALWCEAAAWLSFCSLWFFFSFRDFHLDAKSLENPFPLIVLPLVPKAVPCVTGAPQTLGTGLEPDNLYMFYSCYIINYFHRRRPRGFIFSQLQLLVTSFNDINKFAALVFQALSGKS